MQRARPPETTVNERFTKMLVLATATVLTLAVGITLAFLKVNIWAAAAFIGRE